MAVELNPGIQGGNKTGGNNNIFMTSGERSLWDVGKKLAARNEGTQNPSKVTIAKYTYVAWLMNTNVLPDPNKLPGKPIRLNIADIKSQVNNLKLSDAMWKAVTNAKTADLKELFTMMGGARPSKVTNDSGRFEAAKQGDNSTRYFVDNFSSNDTINLEQIDAEGHKTGTISTRTSGHESGVIQTVEEHLTITDPHTGKVTTVDNQPIDLDRIHVEGQKSGIITSPTDRHQAIDLDQIHVEGQKSGIIDSPTDRHESGSIQTVEEHLTITNPRTGTVTTSEDGSKKITVDSETIVPKVNKGMVTIQTPTGPLKIESNPPTK